MAALQATLNASATGLSPYDVRKAQAALDALAVAAEETRGRVMPRKKFQFSHQRYTGAAPLGSGAPGSRRAPSGPADEPTSGGGALGAVSTAAARPGDGAGDAHATGAATGVASSSSDDDDYTIAHRVGETIVVSAEALEAHFAARAGGGASGGRGEPPHDGSGEAAPPLPPGASAAAARDGDASRLQPPAPPPPPPPRVVGGDLRLLGLTDCIVLIPAPLRALRVDRLTRCVVLAGPVGGSLLLHDCSHVTLAVASRQVRLHRSAHCDLYLRPSSRPIIEHCSSLRLAPCGVTYPAWRSHLAATGLQAALERAEQPLAAAAAAAAVAAYHNPPSSAATAAAGGTCGPPLPLWRCVDDFGWLRAQASPNWAALPPSAWMRSSSEGQPAATDSVHGATVAAAGAPTAVVVPLAAVGLAALPAAAAALCGMSVAYEDQPWLLQPPPEGGASGDGGGGAQAPAAAAVAGASDDDEL